MQTKLTINKFNTDNDNTNPEILRNPYVTSDSAVAWPAIIAGALISTTMSLALLLLGSGLGLAAISPWSNEGITATTFTIATIAWLIVMQFASSGLGGYLTGRLRKKWVNTPENEVYFRDTAHGLLSWALATAITAVFLTSAVASVVSGGTKAATTVVAAGAAGATYEANSNSSPAGDMNNYFIDSLFRSESSNLTANDMRVETIRILTLGMTEGKLSEGDRTYLAQTIAARTGITQEQANRRIDDVITKLNIAQEKAKEEVDVARKAGMKGKLFMFASLLIGAFVASFFAAFGGRQRDAY